MQIAGQPSVLIPNSDGLRGNEAFLRRMSMNFNFDNRGGFVTANSADAGSVRWIQDRMDDLDVRIAQRDFEEAMRSIEKGKANFFPNILMNRTSITCLDGFKTS